MSNWAVTSSEHTRRDTISIHESQKQFNRTLQQLLGSREDRYEFKLQACEHDVTTIRCAVYAIKGPT